MDTTPTTAANEPPVAETASVAPAAPRVNWGRIMKGVALVAAVALVGVVSYHLLFAAAAPLATDAVATSTFGSIAEGISRAASWVGTALTTTVSYIAGALYGLLEMGLKAVGLSGVAWTGGPATQQALALAGGAVGTAVATHVATPHLHGLGTPPVDSSAALPADTTTLVATQTAAHSAAHGSTLHDITHAAHHAAESAESSHDGQKNWRQQFANKSAFANHSEAVRASQGSKPTLAARADSFSEQLNADRASLDQALAK